MANNRGGDNNDSDAVGQIHQYVERVPGDESEEVIELAVSSDEYQIVVEEIESERGIRPDDDQSREVVFRVKPREEDPDKEDWFVYTVSTEDPDSGSDISGNIYHDLCTVAVILRKNEVVKAGVLYNSYSAGEATDEEFLYSRILEAWEGELKTDEESEEYLSQFKEDVQNFAREKRCPGCQKVVKLSIHCGTVVGPIVVWYLVETSLKAIVNADFDVDPHEGWVLVRSGIDIAERVWGQLPKTIRDEARGVVRSHVKRFSLSAVGWTYHRLNHRQGDPPANVDLCTGLGFCP